MPSASVPQRFPAGDREELSGRPCRMLSPREDRDWRHLSLLQDRDTCCSWAGDPCRRAAGFLAQAVTHMAVCTSILLHAQRSWSNCPNKFMKCLSGLTFAWGHGAGAGSKWAICTTMGLHRVFSSLSSQSCFPLPFLVSLETGSPFLLPYEQKSGLHTVWVSWTQAPLPDWIPNP